MELNLDLFKNINKIYLGFSGGLDSTVLLYLLHNNKNLASKITAVHINHNINHQSDMFKKHCEDFCKKNNIKYITHKLNLNIKNNLENNLRLARYNYFKKLITNQNTILLTAHHQDDQAETVLLNLLRGSGPMGLSGIKQKQSFNSGYLIRPLLNYSREQIYQYALENNLSWVEDESNRNTNFNRNYLRHKILPVLKSNWPSATKTIARSAVLNQEYCDLLYLEYRDLINTKNLLLNNIKFHPIIKQKILLKLWLEYNNFKAPQHQQLEELVKQINKNLDSFTVAYPNCEIKLFQKKLYCLDPNNLNKKNNFDINLIPDDLLKKLNIKNRVNLEIRYRQGGERFKPPGRQGSHPLKKLFQEWGIPPWERDTIPLIYYDNKLVWVYVQNLMAK